MTGDRSHFTLSAADYEQARSGHLEARRLALVERVLRAQEASVGSVLELGFGSGKLLASLAEQFPQIDFTGTEVEPKMVAYARERYAAPNLHFLLADMRDREVAQRFDFAFSIDVLHHIHTLLPFLRALRAAMARQGVWLAIEPNVYHPYIFYQQERMRRGGLDEDHFRPWVFEPLLGQAGFALRVRRYAFLFPGWVRNLPDALRRLERRHEHRRTLAGSVVYLVQAA